DRPLLAEEREAGLKLCALKDGQPVLPADLRIHELGVCHRDNAGRRAKDSLPHAARRKRHELAAHPNDLRSVRVEVDLAVDRGETRRAGDMWMNVNPSDRNRASADPKHGHRVAARKPIVLFPIWGEWVNCDERVTAPA